MTATRKNIRTVAIEAAKKVMLAAKFSDADKLQYTPSIGCGGVGFVEVCERGTIQINDGTGRIVTVPHSPFGRVFFGDPVACTNGKYRPIL